MKWLPLLLLIATPTFGQAPMGGIGNEVTPGWTYLQSDVGTNTGAGFTDCLGSNQHCTIKLAVATTAHSSIGLGFENSPGGANSCGTGVACLITSAFTCVSSNPCLSNSGDLVDTFTLVPSSGCAISNGTNDRVDCVYVANSAGGAKIVTANMNGNPATSNYMDYYFIEILAPSCGASVCTPSFDKLMTPCSSAPIACTSTAITGTDGMVGFLDTGAPATTNNYLKEQTGNVFGVDLTSAPAFSVTVNGGAYWSFAGLTFKNTAGFFSPAPPVFTSNVTSLFGSTSSLYFANITGCGSGCSFTPAPASGSGDLLVIGLADVSGTVTISSVTGRTGGSWTVPAASASPSTTCGLTFTSMSLSCAYATAGGGSLSGAITVTTSANCTSGPSSNGCYFIFYDIARNDGGTWTIGSTKGSTSTTNTTILTGQTPTLSTNSLCIQDFGWTGSASGYTQSIATYPFPGGSDNFQVFSGAGPHAATLLLMNTTNQTAPTVQISANSNSWGTTLLCFK